MFVIQLISTRQRYTCSFTEQSLHWCGRLDTVDSSIELAKKKFNHWESMQMFNCFRTWFLQVSQAFYGNLSSLVLIFGRLITVIFKVKKVICRNVRVLCFGFCRITRTFSGFFQNSSLHTFLLISLNPPQVEVDLKLQQRKCLSLHGTETDDWIVFPGSVSKRQQVDHSVWHCQWWMVIAISPSRFTDSERDIVLCWRLLCNMHCCNQFTLQTAKHHDLRSIRLNVRTWQANTFPSYQRTVERAMHPMRCLNNQAMLNVANNCSLINTCPQNWSNHTTHNEANIGIFDMVLQWSMHPPVSDKRTVLVTTLYHET